MNGRHYALASLAGPRMRPDRRHPLREIEDNFLTRRQRYAPPGIRLDRNNSRQALFNSFRETTRKLMRSNCHRHLSGHPKTPAVQGISTCASSRCAPNWSGIAPLSGSSPLRFSRSAGMARTRYRLSSLLAHPDLGASAIALGGPAARHDRQLPLHCRHRNASPPSRSCRGRMTAHRRVVEGPAAGSSCNAHRFCFAGHVPWIVCPLFTTAALLGW